MEIKYRVHEFAKDFGAKSAEIMDLLDRLETKERTQSQHDKLIHRLNRIEGQIRGIRGMLEKDAYCIDILVQVAAANAALNAFSKELLDFHKAKIEERAKAENRKPSFQMVIDDVYAIGKGRLVGRPKY